MDANESEKIERSYFLLLSVFFAVSAKSFCLCCLYEYELETIVDSVDSVFLAQHFLFHLLILTTVMAFLCPMFIPIYMNVELR